MSVSPVPSRPPRGLALAVAMIAAGMLLFELIATRVFSVLFYYHFSFFAVSLVMSGLAFGGLLAARWNVRDMEPAAFDRLLSILALAFSIGSLLALGAVLERRPMAATHDTNPRHVVTLALTFLPGLVGAGAFLAVAFARRDAWISRLYAADLLAAAVACIGAIYLMRASQGPAAILAPAALGALAAAILQAAPRRHRLLGGGIAALCALAFVAHLASGGRLLRLRSAELVQYERWNEHSRVIVRIARRDEVDLIIDKIAGAKIPKIGPPVDGRPPVESWWDKSITGLAYRLGRPLDRVAIIGVGGGIDLLAPLANDAKAIDGYELNDSQIDILENAFKDWCHLADMPGVELIHSEARVGIRHSGLRYDVIQASMIDTWAATASGGFVLSENGLYTIEGWRTFLEALSPGGILTMTRWHVPGAPAETRRLVALACAALEAAGVPDPRAHVVLVAQGLPDDTLQRAPGAVFVTILVSPTPFRPSEVAFLQAECERIPEMPGWAGEPKPIYLLAAPGVESPDPTIDALLDPARRQETIESSFFDLSPTTDERPYFFLQMRPRDFWKLRGSGENKFVLDVTINGVRILMMLVILSLLFALLVLRFGTRSAPSARATPAGLRLQRLGGLYFLGIGLGYMFVQLGLHQRLILALGSPTLALSVVLFSMLLGTGAGAALSERLFRDRASLPAAWLAIVVGLALLVAVFPLFARFEDVPSGALRAGGIGFLMATVGVFLGFGFPLGVRLVAPAGELAVQRMWAINGAASIAGSALAAAAGVALGSRMVVMIGLGCYVVVAAVGALALRVGIGDGTEKVENGTPASSDSDGRTSPAAGDAIAS